MKSIEPFDVDGLTPSEVTEKICATIMVLTAEAYTHGYLSGHKDGMEEAVTTITE